MTSSATLYVGVLVDAEHAHMVLADESVSITTASGFS